MARRTMAGLMVLVASSWVLSQPAAVKPSPWLTDFSRAQSQARQTGKPILAVFH